MSTDIGYIFQWWIMFFILGIIFLPLTVKLFNNFFDKGYALSKVLATLLVSYSVWLISSFKILSFDYFTVTVVVAAALVINIIVAKRVKFIFHTKPFIHIFILEEILFLAGLIFWAYVRAHEPSIHGLEKYMDFGFINSILRSQHFPPADLWLTPHSINYYYFGHLTAAVLTKISGIDPAIAYNLTLSSLFAITISASFSIGANIYHFLSPKNFKKIITTGILASVLVTLGGNLHTIYAFFANYTPAENPVPFWTLKPEFNLLGYWYPNATRFIVNTIHEFPIYSFVVADLHGHVLNIPFVLLIIALLLQVFFSTNSATHRWVYVLFGLLIATSLMTNVLDGPIYLLVLAVMLFLTNIRKYQTLGNPLKLLKVSLKESSSTILIVLITAILFSLPFWFQFKPFASGIGLLCAPKFLTDTGKFGPFLFEADHCSRSPLWMLAILYGFPIATSLTFLYKLIKVKFSEWSDSDYLAITMVIAALILITIPEFFYAKDIYPAHYRANTVFKFGYQAFMILAITSAYMLRRIIDQKAYLPKFLLLVLFALVATYPYFAINSYYGGLKNYKGLDGLTYLNDSYQDDYKAILWINQNIQGQPVILEAQGDSYTDFARVSANTGLPTVIGWPVHEWLWRGSYDEAGKRSTEVASIYQEYSPDQTEEMIKKYKISYVFIGALERQKYQKLDENKFYNLGQEVFRSNQTVIYKLKT